MKFVLFLFILGFPHLVLSTTTVKSHNEQKMSAKLSCFLDTHDSITDEMKEKAIQKITDFEASFKITPTNEVKTLRRLFFSVQETFLKEYALYSSFFQTIESGKFDCLTGSILYAVLLEQIKEKGGFSYEYQVVQMPTHVFVKIELSDKSEIIFESTAAESGFIATNKKVAFYLKKQEKKLSNKLENENVILLDKQTFNNLVTLEEALSLLYFNQGVLFFNQRKFGKSLRMAHNAYFFYKNEAFNNLAQLSLKELYNKN